MERARFAQRRMFELKTELPSVTASERQAGIDELEALYELPEREPDHGLG